MLATARKRIPVARARAEELPFANASFDTVLFVTSLTFIPGYARAIAEAYRVLRENGRLVAVVLNTASRYFQQRYAKKGYVWKNIRHTATADIEACIAQTFSVEKRGLFCIEGEDLRERGEAAVFGLTGIKEGVRGLETV
jgi:ubiquinone/menaquinone biosynthesis C-methylase UbiE